VQQGSGRSIDEGIGLRASVLLVLGAFRSAFLAAPSVGVTAASQGTFSLRRRFGRGDFILLAEMRKVHVRDFSELFWWGTRQATKWAPIPACSGIITGIQRGQEITAREKGRVCFVDWPGSRSTISLAT
jgi:hypothetical protein